MSLDVLSGVAYENGHQFARLHIIRAYDKADLRKENRQKGGIMAMERYSIQVGNCYIDSFRVIYEVKSIQKDEATVLIYQETLSGGQLKQETTMPMKDFLDDLQGQVACPGSTAL